MREQSSVHYQSDKEFLKSEKILFVHIGTHKTGTTSIQEFIRANAGSLAKHDLYIPDAGTIASESGHHNIAWQLRGDSRYCKSYGNVNSLLNELENCSQGAALISSEDFEYLVEGGDALKGFELKLININWRVIYILVLRKQKDYLRSLYAELIRHGCNVKYDEFVLRIIKNGKFCWADGWCFYFDYYQFVNKLRSITDAELRIVSYTNATANNSLVTDVVNKAIPIESLKSELRVPNKLHVSACLLQHDFSSKYEIAITTRFLLSNFLLRIKYGIGI